MPPRRRIDPSTGTDALRRWRDNRDTTPRDQVATAVRFTLEELAARAPGRSVEVRVPPYGAVQCMAGPRHIRGTPPNVVETDAQTWLALVTGDLEWARARRDGTVRASGERADLHTFLPLMPAPAETPPAGAPGCAHADPAEPAG